MDESRINLENVLEQAPKWTFAGDYTLLQWMKQISQDLETRASKTSDDLTRLNNNIKSTNIGLDNLANRLTRLQFGNQFVECRVQDDDETLMNSSEQSKHEDNQPETTITPKELLNTFLENNLKVLRNCHERYSIDLDDSDDEEISKEKTCIYQPINPYNEKPLPYIFGSKDWHSKWHVGLYETEQDNSCSGDEMSEAFSETSSTSHVDDNESFESNTEWASSNSIDNDNFNANIEVNNASSLRGAQSLHPGTSVPINAATNKLAATISESSSVSTTPSSWAKKSMQTKTQPASLTKRSESMNSVNSLTSSKKAAGSTVDKRENTLQYKMPKQAVVDLFAEPGVSENASSSSVSSDQNAKRMANDNQFIRREGTPALRTQPVPFLDLFAEPPEDLSSSTTSLASSHNVKQKIVNLFDDNVDGNEYDAKEEKSIKPDDKEKMGLPSVLTGKPISLTNTSKSLFDDSDDDDDFLKAFVKKSLPKESTKSSLSSTLLFDNETKEPTINASRQTNANKIMVNDEYSNHKSQNLFDETNTKQYNIFSDKVANTESEIPVRKPKKNDIKSSNVSKPLASHVDKASVEENVKKSDNAINDFVAEIKTRKKINLFDDLEAEDDLFSTISKRNKKTSSQNTSNIVENKTVQEVTPNFAHLTENQLEKSGGLRNENPDPETPESIEKNQTFSKNVAPDTIDKPGDNKSLQVVKEINDNQKLVEPPMQEQNSTTPRSTENIVASTPENNNQKIKLSNKYEFSSILFSDEPPEDDDEFFETLAKTPTNSNSNYNTIDLENDIFEPDLPKIPVASTSNNNQTDSTDNFYTGLQLFSDIPPDDDDNDNGDGDAMSSSVLNPASDASQTKRLHGVFYDDFDETRMALNKHQIDKEIPEHSIFNDEPLPMNNNPSFSGKDLTDHTVPDKEEHDAFSYFRKGESQENNFYSEKTLLQQSNDRTTLEVSNKRQVSKLQMPQININVQALLPGAGNALRKPKDDDKKSNVFPSSKHESKLATNLPEASSNDGQLRAGKMPLAETPRTAETEHILPNMTKNRVKAPATRRPSTRRARQENYRRSLTEQQNISISDDDPPEPKMALNAAAKDIINQTFPQNKNSKDLNDDAFKSNYSAQVSETAAAATFNVTETPNGTQNVGNETAKQSSIKNIENPTGPAVLSSKSKEVGANDETPKSDALTLRSNQMHHRSLFSDADEEDDDDDDDFFEHIKTANILVGTQKAKESVDNLLTKSSLNANDLPHSATNTNTALTPQKPPQQSALLSKEISKSDAQSVTNQVQQASHKKIPNQSSANNLKSLLNDEVDDEDEDLFKTTAMPSKRMLPNRDTNSKAKSQFKSFLDSETDEELPNVAGATSTSANLKNTTNDKAKPFSDSETDSDDLFGKFASTKVLPNKKVSATAATKSQTKPPEPKSITLFEDDSDSDDFLSSKGSLNKNVPKTVTQTNASLFSDLDSDEDDLFGSGAGKLNPANVTNVKPLKPTPAPLSNASAPESSKSQANDDNPLADLL